MPARRAAGRPHRERDKEDSVALRVREAEAMTPGTGPAAGQQPGTRRGPVGRRPCGRVLLWGCTAGLLAASGVEAWNVLIGSNFHTVIPGRVYRGAQQTGAGLERLVRADGIRTVVN